MDAVVVQNRLMVNMTKHLSSRVVLNFLLINFVLLTITSLVLTTALSGDYKNQFLTQAEISSKRLAGLIEVLEANTMAGRDNRSIFQAVINDLLLSGEIVYIDIAVPTILLSDLVQDEVHLLMVGKLSPQHDYIVQPDKKFAQGRDNIYYTSLPLSSWMGMPSAFLRIGFDERPTLDRIQLTYVKIALTLIVYMIFAMLCMALVTAATLDPLRRYLKISRKVSLGNYHEHMQENCRGIIEFERMFEDLNSLRTELVRQTDALEHLSLHDELTKLPNRNLLHERLRQATSKFDVNLKPFALLSLDLKNFNHINDSLGHQAGDIVLKETALKLRGLVKEIDLVARTGTDEFALLIRHVDEKAALVIAHQVSKVISLPFFVKGHEVHISASIGVVLYPEQTTDYTQILRYVDAALHESKRSGLNVVLYQDCMDQDSLIQLQLANELRESLRNGELEVYYQPKICLHDGSLVGFEGLVRWLDGSRGVIPPEQFIAIAEQTGLIQELTLSVIDRAITDLKRWQRIKPHLTVAINLSAVSLVDDRMAEDIIELVKLHGLPFHFLELELTETAVLNDLQKSIEILEKLSACGIRVAIDDFGTGYSSLSYLKELPVDTVKIDRSFVTDLFNNENDEAIVRATVEMAHGLGLKVVAEGVESVEALMLLSDMGCDMGQGYFISVPISAKDCYRYIQGIGDRVEVFEQALVAE